MSKDKSKDAGKGENKDIYKDKSKDKSKYKICVYAITKNESQFVDRWVDSMSEADEIIVTDTGSTDNTVEKLKDRGVVVYEEVIKPWRFDVARNLSLAHVPDDTDIAVCTDLDEVLTPGWRKAIEEVWQPDTTMGNYLYNWSLNEDGTPNTQLTYFKVHKKSDYTWTCPVHEYLRYIGGGIEKKVYINSMVLNHYPDQAKSRSSYLPLLEMAVEEDPLGDRMRYYLGREYMFAGRWQDCIDTLKIHLSLPSAWWREERCASMRWIAKSYYELGNLDECYRWFYRAIAELPTMRDPYVEFAKTAYLKEDWLTVFYAASEALKITEKSNAYTNSGYAWDFTPDDLMAIACYWLGMYDIALTHAKNALAMEPENERLKSNLKFIEQKL